MIETGIELIDAIVNYPMQTIGLFGLGYLGYKYLSSRNFRMKFVMRDLSRSYLDIEIFVGHVINNRFNSFCRLEVDMLDKVYKIIKTRYAFNWRQKEIINDELGLSYDKISQLVKALLSLEKITWDKDDTRLVTTESQNEVITN